MEGLSHENLSRLVTSPDLLSHLQALKLDGGKKNVSFQWLGPHLLAFLKYAKECFDTYGSRLFFTMRDLRDLLKRLDDSASDFILYGEIFSHFEGEHYKNILETILTVMPELNKFFTIQGPISNNSIVYNNWEIFIDFLFESIRELLGCHNDSTVLVSNEVKFLQEGLNFLLTFLVYPIPCDEEEQKKSILTEIEAVFNEVGLFLHSFFFTTDLVTSTEMDLAIFVLLERIEMVLVKIKYYSIAVSSEVGIGIRSLQATERPSEAGIGSLKVAESPSEVGIGSLQVAESPSEVSSSQGKSIPMVEEIIVGLEDTTTQIVQVGIGSLKVTGSPSEVGIGSLKLAESSSEIGIGSLQVAEGPSEVSSSQDKSIPMVGEIIVGLEDTVTQIVEKLVGGPNNRQIISIVGMGGLGKTTLAKKIYNHSFVRVYFEKLAWCAVSQTYNKRKLLNDILSSLCDLKKDDISKMEDEELPRHLYKNLKGRRYLIVMDDLWDKKVWDDLKMLFPDDGNGSRALITSRQKNVASEISQVIIDPSLLSPGESWNLLEQKVFNKERCPRELQDIGKQIAENCEGLPLLVVLIAGILSNMEKEESLWQRVAKSFNDYILLKADDYIPTLKLSYINLPDHLKPCFLYLSTFQEDKEIPVRKLLLLWIAGGLVEKKEHKSLEDVAEEYLMELIDRSLLQVVQRRSDNGVKACNLHYLVLNMCSTMVEEDEKLLFQHQFLVSKHCHLHRLYMGRFLHVWMSDNISEAFSIVYNLEKIRILEMRKDKNVRLGIKIMPDLRYLEFTRLDPSISKLHNLEYLCLLSVNDVPAYLLNMPKLRHLRVNDKYGGARFTKNSDSFRINCLQTLGYIRIVDSEDEEILRCSPNLRTLKFESPDNYFPDLNFLSQLQSLRIARDPSEGDYSVIKFPMNIKKISLGVIGLPWEKMSLIGTLPNLEILKLGYKSFSGKIWDTKYDEFQKLKFLKLDMLDLEQWNSSTDHFPVLERLVLRNCKSLVMIPSEFSFISTLQKIEVFDCGKSVKTSALEIGEEQWDYGNTKFDVTIRSI